MNSFIEVGDMDEDEEYCEPRLCLPMACDGTIIETIPLEDYTVPELIIKMVYPNMFIHTKPIMYKPKRWGKKKKIWKRGK
jgi:hypothetical protein